MPAGTVDFTVNKLNSRISLYEGTEKTYSSLHCLLSTIIFLRLAILGLHWLSASWQTWRPESPKIPYPDIFLLMI